MQTFWHSSSHALGEALEAEFGADLTIGPALEEGFYYDCYLGDRVLTEADKPRIQKHIDKVGVARQATIAGIRTDAMWADKSLQPSGLPISQLQGKQLVKKPGTVLTLVAALRAAGEGQGAVRAGGGVPRRGAGHVRGEQVQGALLCAAAVYKHVRTGTASRQWVMAPATQGVLAPKVLN
jgi:hypothetical protein